MSSFVLKIIAIVSMFCDHFSDALGNFSFLNLIGRLAFPIFAFQVTQGYIHTKSFKNYVYRLFGFGLVSQLPFTLFNNACGYPFGLNIFATLLLGLLSIFAYDKISNSKINFFSNSKESDKNNSNANSLKKVNTILALIICFGIASFGDLIKVDYGMYGIALVLFFYIFRNNRLASVLSTIVLTTMYYLPNVLINTAFSNLYIYCIIATCLALIPICFYNGKEGPKCKYLFYIFYPLHLLILSFF